MQFLKFSSFTITIKFIIQQVFIISPIYKFVFFSSIVLKLFLQFFKFYNFYNNNTYIYSNFIFLFSRLLCIVPFYERFTPEGWIIRHRALIVPSQSYICRNIVEGGGQENLNFEEKTIVTHRILFEHLKNVQISSSNNNNLNKYKRSSSSSNLKTTTTTNCRPVGIGKGKKLFFEFSLS